MGCMSPAVMWDAPVCLVLCSLQRIPAIFSWVFLEHLPSSTHGAAACSTHTRSVAPAPACLRVGEYLCCLLFSPRLLGASQHRGLTDLCAGEAEQHGQLGLAQGDLLCLPPQHAPALGLHLALCTHTSGCR